MRIRSSFLRVTIALIAVTLSAGGQLAIGGTSTQNLASAPTKVATIPIEIDAESYVFLKARVNGSEPLTFELDSGAGSGLVLYFKAAQRLGVKLQDKGKGSGGGESTFDTSFIKDASLSLAEGVEITNQTFVVFPPERSRPASDRAVDGVIGYAFFSRYVVAVDYQARVLNLYEPKTYQYNGSGESIPIRILSNVPFARVKLPISGGKPIDGEFIVDMGAGRFTLILNTPLVKSRGLLAVYKTIQDLGAKGVGGDVKLLVGRLPELQLGRVTFSNPLIYFAQDRKGAFGSSEFSGVIGGELLRRFKVIFDYAHKRMYLEPNSNVPDAFEYDMSGMRVNAEGENLKIFKVQRVAENSPAFVAGVREGDAILAVDGTPAADLSRSQINQMFKEVDKEHVLEIMSGEKRKQVRFNSRRLI